MSLLQSNRCFARAIVARLLHNLSLWVLDGSYGVSKKQKRVHISITFESHPEPSLFTRLLGTYWRDAVFVHDRAAAGEPFAAAYVRYDRSRRRAWLVRCGVPLQLWGRQRPSCAAAAASCSRVNLGNVLCILRFTRFQVPQRQRYTPAQ